MIERLPTSAFTPSAPVYVDAGLHSLFDRLAFRASLVLAGAKGTGKSLSVAAWAAKRGCPLITFDCSEDVRRSHLLGGFVLRGNETPFVLGPLTTAFEVANETGEAILCLEEINALSPQMQKVLNSSLDFRRKIEVPECGRVFRLEPGKRLWVAGTMNTACYGGVYELNEDLKSRIRLIAVDYPDTATERKIAHAVLESLQIRPAHGIVDKVLTLAHETRQKAMDYALSTRDVTQVLEDADLVGPEKALWILSGKFEGEDRATFGERVQSIFGFKPAAKAA